MDLFIIEIYIWCVLCFKRWKAEVENYIRGDEYDKTEFKKLCAGSGIGSNVWGCRVNTIRPY